MGKTTIQISAFAAKKLATIAMSVGAPADSILNIEFKGAALDLTYQPSPTKKEVSFE